MRMCVEWTKEYVHALHGYIRVYGSICMSKQQNGERKFQLLNLFMYDIFTEFVFNSLIWCMHTDGHGERSRVCLCVCVCDVHLIVYTPTESIH